MAEKHEPQKRTLQPLQKLTALSVDYGHDGRSLEKKQTNTNALAQHSGLFHQRTSERYGSRLLTCQMCILLVPDVNLAAVWTPDLTAVDQQI